MKTKTISKIEASEILEMIGDLIISQSPQVSGHQEELAFNVRPKHINHIRASLLASYPKNKTKVIFNFLKHASAIIDECV